VADTGAPWNIPFAEPTDLVRDWPQLSEDVADAVAAGLTAAGNPGIGSNVVQAVKTDHFTTTSSTLTDLTGLTVTITPSNDTAKILLVASINFSHSVTNELFGFQFVRGSTNIGVGTGGSLSNLTFAAQNASATAQFVAAFVLLDSPAVDTATTYKMQARTVGGTLTVNRAGNNTLTGSISSLTAIEVAA